MTTKLTIRADERPVWLCFEPWANDFTVAPGTAVTITFCDDQLPVELVHRPDGIVFLSLGRHPDIWTEDGEPLRILSDVMPETQLAQLPAFRSFMAAVPPIRSDPDP